MKTLKNQIAFIVVIFVVIAACYVYSESFNYNYECLKIEKGY